MRVTTCALLGLWREGWLTGEHTVLENLSGGMDWVGSSIPAFPEQVPGTPDRKKVLAPG